MENRRSLECKTIARVSKFMTEFAKGLGLMFDSYLIEHDLEFDCDILKDWADNKAYTYVPFISYVRKHGTFTNWGARSDSETRQNFIDWADQEVGRLEVTRENGMYVVKFYNSWK